MSLCFAYGLFYSLLIELSSFSVSSFNYLHPDELLIGKFAGTWVTQASGAPGSDYSIRVRGSSSIFGGAEPLYVINGIPHYNTVNNSAYVYGSGVDFLSLIDPSNIKEVKVLSNIVATAQYGSRGANGVILIETKDGAEEAFSVDFQTFTGYQNTYKLPTLLDGSGFAFAAVVVFRQSHVNGFFIAGPFGLEIGDQLCLLLSTFKLSFVHGLVSQLCFATDVLLHV